MVACTLLMGAGGSAWRRYYSPLWHWARGVSWDPVRLVTGHTSLLVTEYQAI